MAVKEEEGDPSDEAAVTEDEYDVFAEPPVAENAETREVDSSSCLASLAKHDEDDDRAAEAAHYRAARTKEEEEGGGGRQCP